MKNISNLLWEYRFIIVLLVSIVLYIVLEWEKFKRVSYGVMLQAKSLAKDKILKSGKQQEEWVVKKMYQFLPKALTVFISDEVMKKIVHFLYVKGKDYLDDGKLNNSIE
ncbi:hypothetical protein HAHI6034_05830 [Hathewaya histolytica]|uniref:Uncharacterized protein n=1 Tax=Hathewaya histolytica TaxID=1498 RepID=A0A4U9RDE4_HATHI|nr:hypothetical protein [Hathewaya histolytica]VTQ89659.1 Uncharacterised protein [Hathewaya histolytica]